MWWAVKPATNTCWLANRVVEVIAESGILPDGALQLICGSVGDLFDHMTCQDVLGFTGSAATANLIKANPSLVKNAVRNAEAHGQASEVTLSTGDGRLTISDNGQGCSTEDLEQAWKAGLRPNGTRSAGTQIMRRVADAHDAEVTLQGEPGIGVRIVVDVRDLEIDLRQRGAIESPIGTHHKASGGRLTPMP